jgi:hypothetical protein
MGYAKAISVVFIILLFTCYADRIDASNYSLTYHSNFMQIAMGVTTPAPTAFSSAGISSISLYDLDRKIAMGRSLGVVGTVLWSSGKILEGVGIIIFFSGHDARAGLSFVIPGMILDIIGPIPSCIGEGIVMNSMAESGLGAQVDNIRLQAKGRGYYQVGRVLWGVSFLFNVVAAGVSAAPLGVIGMIIGGAGEILRGVAAIAPLVRVQKVSNWITFNARPFFDIEGNTGIALSAQLVIP